MNTKARIQAAFDSASITYEAHCPVQNEACQVLLQLSQPFLSTPKHIADIGCGIGLSTQQLQQYTPYDILAGIDFSKRSLAIAKRKLRNCILIQSDFDQCNLQANSINLMFSNMALQWSLNLRDTMKTLLHQLQRKGLLAFSLPIFGTFPEINEQHRNSFHHHTDIINIIKHLNANLMQTKQHKHIVHFQSPVDALRSLKKTGANCIIHKKPIWKSTLRKVFNNHHKKQSLTYHIGYYLIQKV